MWSVWQTCRTGRRAAGFLGGLLVALLLAAGPAAGEFGSPIVLTDTPVASMRPAIAIDGLGQVFLAWREGNGALDGTIMLRRSKPPKQSCGGPAPLTLEDFDPPVLISAGTVGASSPSLAVAGSDVFFAWQVLQGLNGFSDIYFRRCRNGCMNPALDLDQAFNLSNTPASSTFPNVTTDGNGRVFVAWSDSTAPNGTFMPAEILVARSADGGADKFPVRANLSGTQPVMSRAPWVGTDGVSVYLAWDEGSTIAFRKFSATTTDMLGTATPQMSQAPQNLSSGLGLSSSPALGVGDGMVVVSWVSGSAVYESTPDGVNPPPAPVLVAGNLSGPSDARVARRGGNTLMAWQHMNGTNPDIGFRVLGASPEGPGTVPPAGTPGTSSTPAAAVDSSGRMVVAWADRTSGNDEIYLSENGVTGGGSEALAEVRVMPQRVNRRTIDVPGQPSLTVFVRLPGGSQINRDSMRMNGQSPLPGPTDAGEYNGGGAGEVMLKFSRSVLNYSEAGKPLALPNGKYKVSGKTTSGDCFATETGTLQLIQ